MPITLTRRGTTPLVPIRRRGVFETDRGLYDFTEPEEAPEVRQEVGRGPLELSPNSIPPPSSRLSRMDQLQEEWNKQERPRTMKEKLLTALIEAAPIVAGGLIGGEEGLIGASSAISQNIDERRARRDFRRERLLKRMERESDIDMARTEAAHQRVERRSIAEAREAAESERLGRTLEQREAESKRETEARSKDRMEQYRIQREERERERQFRSEEKEKDRQLRSDIARSNREATAANRDTLNSFRTASEEDRMRDDYELKVKPFREANLSKRKFDEAMKDDTGASDIAILYNFIKLMDPNAVREGELALVRGTGTFMDSIKIAYNKYLAGKRDVLTPGQRSEMGRVAKDYHKTMMSSKRDVDSQYESISKDRGLNPENVVDYSYGRSSTIPPGARIHTYPSGRQAWYDEKSRKWIPVED